jgi:hypothetical protein
MIIYIQRQEKSFTKYIAYVEDNTLFNPTNYLSITFTNDVIGLIIFDRFIEMIKYMYNPDKIKIEVIDKKTCSDFIYFHNIISKIGNCK